MNHQLSARAWLLLALTGAVALVVLIAPLLGWPQRAYMTGYDALAYPPQALGEAIRASRGHGHVTSWETWMRDVPARYQALRGRGYSGMGPVLLLELTILLVVPALVLWRIVWFLVTRMGRVTPGEPHGSARWMSEGETRRLTYQPGHFLLGTAHGKAVGLDRQRQTMNTLLIGPPGSGKSSGLIIPNLLREPGTRSLVITDLKNELRQTCAAYLAQCHDVWVVNFLDPDRSMAYNPLAYCTDELSTALFCNAWIANTGKSEKEPFWDNATRELLMAGIAHLQATLPDPTLAHLNALLCHQAPDAIIAALERSPSVLARTKALAFLGALKRNDRLLGSVFSEITPRFLVLSDRRVQATTSRSEVDFARLVDPTARPVALFVSLDRTLQDELKPLVAAFFLDLFRTLSQVADAGSSGALPRDVFIYGDEYGNLGAIPKMPIWIATLRGRGHAAGPADLGPGPGPLRARGHGHDQGVVRDQDRPVHHGAPGRQMVQRPGRSGHRGAAERQPAARPLPCDDRARGPQRERDGPRPDHQRRGAPAVAPGDAGHHRGDATAAVAAAALVPG